MSPLSDHTDDEFILAYFFADWCGPCDHIKPVLTGFKQKFGELVKIVEIDIDKNQMASAAFKVRTVPTLILFQKGVAIWNHSGQISVNQLSETIQQKMKH